MTTTSHQRGRFPVRAGGAGLVLSAAGVALAHFGIVPPLAGFGAFALGGLASIVGVLGGAVTSFRHGMNIGRTGIFLGLPGAIAIVGGALSGAGAPPINDITTNVANPPAFVHAPTLPANQGRDMTFPAEFGDVIEEAYPDLATLRLDEPPSQVFSRAALLAGGVPGWTVTYVEDEAGILEGTDESRIFRFVDDFVVRVRPHPEGGTLVDMRSKSRDGRGDLGVNARRIRKFLGKLAASGR